ncbi:MAG: MaoC family dehydratase [SAR202 cluster bacterium]|nr:MaoC family dehydratase [SAR202 cluster bacterium]
MPASYQQVLRHLLATVGKETGYTAPEEIGRAAFRFYSMAVQDANPIYVNQAAAKAVGLRDVAAPPTLVCETHQLINEDMNEQGYPTSMAHDALGGLLRAGNSYEFFQPVHPDDVITVKSKVIKVSEKASRTNRLIFRDTEISYYNQHGQLLAKNIETMVARFPAEASS